jgi:predicted transcriptional regulator of viral defense system
LPGRKGEAESRGPGNGKEKAEREVCVMAKATAQAAEPAKFMRVGEVAEMLGVSESRAYKIMRQLNRELEAKGKITTAGRVSRKYLIERTS